MLGRGLESLIPNKNSGELSRDSDRLNESARPRPASNQEAVFQIEADKIKRNPHQPRKEFNPEALEELASSIREMGIIQPLIVSKIVSDTATGTIVEYQLIAGERRLLAAKKVGMERVPAIVRKINDEREKLELAIVENIQRDDLSSIETARSYAKLQEEFGLTQREVAARVGKSRETVANVLRLLNLPTEIQEAISKKQLSDSQGRLLLGVNDPVQQKNIFNDIINNNLSVRELRLKIDRMKRPAVAQNLRPDFQKEEEEKNPELAIIEEQLQEALGTKVSLQKTPDGGRLTINFFSPEELKAILDKLLPKEESEISADAAVSAPDGTQLI